MKNKYKILIAVLFCGLLVAVLDIDISNHRRLTLYKIMQELRQGMSQPELELVIKRYTTPYLHRHEGTNGLVLRVNTGMGNACLLSINCSDGQLTSARIRGEDGPNEIFKDAPADIGEKKE